MAGTRLVPGERLAARLAARSAQRPRIGVSSQFFARFGFGDPWALDPAEQDLPWDLGHQHGARTGALGLFWSLLERRLLRYLRFGVVFHGGLGGLLGDGWGNWLPLLEGFTGLWRERDLSALGRLPGASRRRWLPWGAYSTPQLSFVLPPMEELEPEEPAHARRFRRRPRRQRAVSEAASLQAMPPDLRPQADIFTPPRRVATRSAPSIAVPAPRLRPGLPPPTLVTQPPRVDAPRRVDLPPELAPAAARRTSPVGIARALLRRDAPAVGTPTSGRAAAGAASLLAPLTWAEARGSDGTFPAPVSGAALPSARSTEPAVSGRAVVPHRPALVRAVSGSTAQRGLPPAARMSARQAALSGADLDLLSWAEARGSQPAAAPLAGVAPELSAARRGLPPEGARRLRAVLGRSPLLAYVQPAPEIEPEPEVVPWAPRPLRRRPGAGAASPAPSAAPLSEAARSRVGISGVLPASPAPAAAAAAAAPMSLPVAVDPWVATEALIAPAQPRAASARVASRLAAATVPPSDARQAYHSLRRVAAPTALQGTSPAFAALPSALQRVLLPLISAEEPGAPSEARSLDALLLRALRAPGRAGRLEQAALRAPGAPASLSTPVRALRAALPGLRSPLLSFLAQIADSHADAAEVETEAEALPRPRRARAGRPVPSEAARVAVPKASSTARALLRAVPERMEGSVLPRAVVRRASADGGRPLSASAFPGSSQVDQTLRQAGTGPGRAGTAPGRAAPSARSMRAPWLPLDRLVRSAIPEAEEAPEAMGEAPRGVRRPSRRPLRPERAAVQPAPKTAHASEAAPRVTPPSGGVTRAALTGSARAAARLLEAAPMVRALPAAFAELDAAPGVAPAPSRGAPRPSPPLAVRDARPVPIAPEGAVRRPQRPPAAGVLPLPVPIPAEVQRAERTLPWGATTPAVVPSSGTERALARLVESISLAQATSQGMAAAWAMRQVASGDRAAAARLLRAAGRAPETLWLQWRAPAEPAPSAEPIGLGGVAARPAWGAPHARAAVRHAESRRDSVVGLVAPTGIGAAPWAAGLPAVEAVALAGVPLGAPSRAGIAPGDLPGRQAFRRLQGRTRPERRLLALTGRPGDVASGDDPTTAESGARSTVRSAVPRRGRAEVASARAGVSQRRGRPATIDALLGSGSSAQVLLSVLHGVEQPEAALQVLLERALGLGRAGHLPAPVQRLVEQVREGAEEGEQEAGATRKPVTATPARESLRRRRRARSLRRAAAGEPARADATVHHVQANYRIAGLVKKLEQLIHLVDVEHRQAAARSQVRMAEDSAAARPTPGSGSAEEARDQQAGQDVDSLVKRIVEDVQDQIGQWSQQRPDDPTANGPWW